MGRQGGGGHFFAQGKQYDRMPRRQIWRSVIDNGVPELSLIQEMYNDATDFVRSLLGPPDGITIRVGVHQGRAPCY